MKISYNWLKEYINTNLSITEITEILTQTGLEVGSVEHTESIKGGLKGVVVGEVKSCEPHPNSDHLNLTQVDVAGEELLPIVCGAPNVAQGQKVMVATVGTTIYSGEDSFTIKKAKLRGEVSMGMICSEVELNVGTDNSGIMVLPAGAKIGEDAKNFFNIKDDYTIEIDITPNRIDGASHIGVARDLSAYLQTHGGNTKYNKPELTKIPTVASPIPMEIIVDDSSLCPRYMGICLDNVKIAPSPEWLQNRLKSIGLSPVNNIVDITNFVLFETGQPLHAFDRAITGNKIIVKTLSEGEKFTTLDSVEQKLSSNDLMICSEDKPLCIAGVLGGLESGVSEKTTSVFLESAYFDSVSVRKTARRHGINTDASFRFERGVDPEMIPYALNRAVGLITEITGATVVSNIIEQYPNPIENKRLSIHLSQIEKLTGINISLEQVQTILNALEIKVLNVEDNTLDIEIPAYRVDVTRQADVIEEILRIYGYDNIPVKNKVSSVLSYTTGKDTYALRNKISDYLSCNSFNEIMNNSLSKSAYYEGNKNFPIEQSVLLKNPLSQDLNVMRQTLLYGGLESIAYNCNRKRNNLSLYEFGRTYFFDNAKQDAENPLRKYSEVEKLSLFLTGDAQESSWDTPKSSYSFFQLKAYVFNILTQLGQNKNKIEEKYISSNIFEEALTLEYNQKTIAQLGMINSTIAKKLDISQTVYFAEIEWDTTLSIKTTELNYTPVPKYPEVKRDFSLLLDSEISFSQVKKCVEQSERRLLKSINLFDVYTGKKLPEGKKSYAISVVLQDENSTLTDKQIDKISNKIQTNLEKQLGASLR